MDYCPECKKKTAGAVAFLEDNIKEKLLLQYQALRTLSEGRDKSRLAGSIHSLELVLEKINEAFADVVGVGK